MHSVASCVNNKQQHPKTPGINWCLPCLTIATKKKPQRLAIEHEKPPDQPDPPTTVIPGLATNSIFYCFHNVKNH